MIEEKSDLIIVQKGAIWQTVKSSEFVRRAKRYARRFGLVASFNPSRGKGSHGWLHIGERFTTVPRKEIGPGLLAAMLNDLNIDKKEF